MPTISFDAFKATYALLFSALQLKSGKESKAKTYYDKMLANRSRYESVAKYFNYKGVPWYLIAVLHMRESDMNFNYHLAEGSPLTGRTKNVPKGLPVENPKAGIGKPYTWEEGAVAAIGLKINGNAALGVPATSAWKNFLQDDSVESLLYKVESYNGFGYRNLTNPIPSPYLYSDSTVQVPGKFVADGKFNATVTDTQMGAATLMKYYLDQQSTQKKK